MDDKMDELNPSDPTTPDETPVQESTAQPDAAYTYSGKYTKSADTAPEAMPEMAPIRPRRRPRSKAQIFKEVYLPVIIAGAALILILIFIGGSLSRSFAIAKNKKEADLAASASAESLALAQKDEAARILAKAEKLADGYNFSEAINCIDSFSGNLMEYPELNAKRDEYVEAQTRMIAWDDPSQIPNLSFHVLVADPARAFVDDDLGSSYRNNFVTAGEFSAILQQLYDNGYILVSLSDFVTVAKDANGNLIYQPKTMYLPLGKKPLMLTETNANYYTYMVDGDEDGIADKDGAGFACRLIQDANGNLVNEMITSTGETVTGAYDMVPILDAFIASHPDFSFNGAKAIIAFTGYDGILGYRTNLDAAEALGQDAYNKQVSEATAIARALRDDGYTLACYSYDNINFGEVASSEIDADLAKWAEEVTPIIGTTDVMVFARGGDISEGTGTYSGDLYLAVRDAGFHFFLGAATKPWAGVQSDYVRQHRIMITGSNIMLYPDLYSNYFDATAIHDPVRDTLPLD